MKRQIEMISDGVVRQSHAGQISERKLKTSEEARRSDYDVND